MFRNTHFTGEETNGGTGMKKKKIFGLGGAVILLVSTSIYAAPVLADQVEKQISAWFNTVTIKVNGKIVQADNLIYEGTTYVP
jgi:type 1 fimbria pilin